MREADEARQVISGHECWHNIHLLQIWEQNIWSLECSILCVYILNRRQEWINRGDNHKSINPLPVDISNWKLCGHCVVENFIRWDNIKSRVTLKVQTSFLKNLKSSTQYLKIISNRWISTLKYMKLKIFMYSNIDCGIQSQDLQKILSIIFKKSSC